MHHGIATHPPAAAFLLVEATLLVNDLTAGDGGQQLPEVAAIDKLSELAASGALVQTPQNAQRDVFLVAHPAGRRTKTRASQLDQLAIVPLPQKTRGIFIAGLELSKPEVTGSSTGMVDLRPKSQIESTCAKKRARWPYACRASDRFNDLRLEMTSR